MSQVVFSSWGDKVIDNRGRDPQRYAKVEDPGVPLQCDGRQVNAFMSWRGLVVNDDKVGIVDMARAYLAEVRQLSCGECSVGYNGVRVMVDLLNKIASGRGTKEDIGLLERVGNGLRVNTKCDFCALAVKPVLDTLTYYGDEYLKAVRTAKPLSESRYATRVTAPCMEACPAHQDAPGYIELIRNRRFDDALALIRNTNCLPGVLGRTCVAFCEANCVRGDIDNPIAIRPLKRVPADDEVASGMNPKFKKKRGTVKVAVIGAGPAGLAASYNLAVAGHKVTIYDEQSAPGGMALVGVPSYRLPRDILSRESDLISGLGIEVKQSTRIGRDISVQQLSDQGFRAIFIATGAHRDREVDIENWNGAYDGVVEGIQFLRDVNLGKKIAPKNRAIIVGGGNVAVDCARTCVRLGCKEVTIVYRRSRTEMPGRPDEIEQAEREGVKLQFLAVPVRVLNKGNKVVGAECIRMELGEPDASGRRRPVPVKGSEFVIDTDMIISAIGEIPDVSFLSGDKPVKTTGQGTIVVDLSTCQTSTPGIFAGGDCVTGPATLIEAIAAGNRAARSIDQYLRMGKVSRSDEDIIAEGVHQVALDRQRQGHIVAKRARRSPEELPVDERKRNFEEVEQCLTTQAATQEAERCLRCYRVMLMSLAGEK